MRSLVVNADDLGLTVGVNDGIFEAHDRGILTSTSLMANAPATANAIRRLARRPALGIGVHLTLVDGAPMLSPDRVSSLLQDDGRLRVSWKPFIVACLQRRVVMDEIEHELAAQVERVLDEGIQPTHLDAHQHVHVYPPVFAIVVRLAQRYRIPVVRVPYEQTLADLPLVPWITRDYATAAAHGIRTPYFAGRALTGTMRTATLARTLRRLRPGHTELMVHPGHVDDLLRTMPTRLLQSRSEEVALLCSPAIADVLGDEGIVLVRHDRRPVIRPRIRSLPVAS